MICMSSSFSKTPPIRIIVVIVIVIISIISISALPQ